MKRETIGKIQVILGIILLIATIIGTLYFRADYINSFTSTAIGVTETWGDVSETLFEIEEQYNLTPGYLKMDILGTVVSDFAILGNLSNLTLKLIHLGAIILAVLSIMFILQGLANMSKK